MAGLSPELTAAIKQAMAEGKVFMRLDRSLHREGHLASVANSSFAGCVETGGGFGLHEGVWVTYRRARHTAAVRSSGLQAARAS